MRARRTVVTTIDITLSATDGARNVIATARCWTGRSRARSVDRQPAARHAPAPARRRPPRALVRRVRDRRGHGPRGAEPHGRPRRARRSTTASTSSPGRSAPASGSQDWSLDPELDAVGRRVADGRRARRRRATADRTRRAARRDAPAALRRSAAKGCWVRPDNLPRASGAGGAWDGRRRAMRLVERDAGRQTPRDSRGRLFGPDAWADRADIVCTARSTTCDGCARRAPTDADLAHAFEAGAAVLAHLRADPLLPEPLCPAPWPGDRPAGGVRAVRSARSARPSVSGSEPGRKCPAMEQLLEAAARVLPDAVDLRRRIHAEPELGLELPTHAGGDPRRARRPRPRRPHRHVDHVGRRRPRGRRPRAARSCCAPTWTRCRCPRTPGSSTRARSTARCTRAVTTPTSPCSSARRVSSRRSATSPGTIRFAFQPGEEGFGGARYMIDEGLLDDPHVDAAFALHVAPNLPSGSIWTAAGRVDGVGRRDRHPHHRQGRPRVDAVSRA